MSANWPKRILTLLAVVVLVALVAFFAWPRPLPADLATVSKGPLDVVISEEGKTLVRHVYTVSAPMAGKVLRISHPDGPKGFSLHVGDAVKKGETVVAVMQPATPSFIDIRSRQELQAALSAAQAAVSLAEAEVKRVEAALEFAQGELRRAEALARSESVSARALEKARVDMATGEAAIASARAQLEVRRAERAAIAARLLDPATATADNPACCVQLRAPATGRVLKIIQDSETVVQAGAPLLEIGDPADLEVVTDLLSTDAVRVKVGAEVRIDGWGGQPIKGRVTRVDPAGFMKVSALGIEEQRVRTRIDLEDPPEKWSALGHDYRVIVNVTVWKADDVLSVPVASLFRKNGDWAVFAVKDGRARATVVSLGQRNNRAAQVTSGLAEGDRVVLHPSDRIKEGSRVEERQVE